MSFDLSYLDQLKQKIERQGTSLFIRTFYGANLVHEFEFTNAPSGYVPDEVHVIAGAILSRIVLGNPASRRVEADRAALKAAVAQSPAYALSELPVSTPVDAGYVYRLGDGSVVVTTAGTTGAAVPTAPIAGITPGTTAAAITSGTAVLWSLNKPVRLPDETRPAPVLTDTAGLSPLTQYNPQTYPEKFEQLSAPFTYAVTSGNSLARSGMYAWNDGSDAVSLGGVGRVGAWSVRACTTDSDVVHIGYFGTSGAGLNESFRVRIDGVLVHEALLRPGAIGSSRYLALTIPGGIRDRVICIESSGHLNLSYIAVPAARYVRAPTQRGRVLGWFSDSFGVTESPAVPSAALDLAPRVGTRLGFRHTLAAAVGGVSYAYDVSGANPRVSLLKQLALNDLSQYTLDAMLFGLSYNATTMAGADAGTEANAAKACWTQFRSKFSGKLLVIGPWARLVGSTAQYSAVRSALRAAFFEFADPSSYFIDPDDNSVVRGDGAVLRGGSSSWIDTASWVMGPDGAHPSPAGVSWFEDRICESAELCLQDV